MAGKTHRIVIEPTTIRGERGQRYRVLFEGEVIIETAGIPKPTRAAFSRSAVSPGRWKSGGRGLPTLP